MQEGSKDMNTYTVTYARTHVFIVIATVVIPLAPAVTVATPGVTRILRAHTTAV